MDFFERLTFLINESGVSRSKFLAEIGAGKNSFVYWENHKNLPSGDTLLKIANYFGVSVDYLLGKEEKEKPAELGELSEGEKALLDLFNRVPADQQELVLRMIEAALSKL